MEEEDADRVRALLSARAVRERAHEMLALCEAGALEHWTADLDLVPKVADYVLAVTRECYPDLAIPFHARWRHLKIGDADRGAPYGPTGRDFSSPAERGRAAFDLAIVSVLLDAGAGPSWRYQADGVALNRSEGLAAASLDMFESGLFSSSRSQPRRVDATALARLSLEDLAMGFQASEGNRLEGLEGRLALLHGLGRALALRPDLFGAHDSSRPGRLFDRFVDRAKDEILSAPAILGTLLDAFGLIWPSRLIIAGVPLGDVWPHPAIRRRDVTDGLVPFHKLSQWMAYSLIEPLQWAGVDVADVDGLTGLPEYRNGGLFIDFGVLRPRAPEELTRRPLRPEEPIVVEWRAMTVALLDHVAARMRRALGLDAAALPLARVLQGGAWSAGRRIARRLRPDGAPPLAIVSDGTVF